MSAPISPGGTSRVSASGSAATQASASRGVQRRDRLPEIADVSECAGILEDRAENDGRIEIFEGVADDDVPAQRLGPRPDHVDGLRMAVPIDEERPRLRFRRALRQRHRLAGGRRLVQQARVRHVESGQVADHGLEIEKGLQPPLADLRLIRRVGGVPGRVLEDVALDDGRRDRSVVSLPDKTGQDHVLGGDLPHPVQHALLAEGRPPVQRPLLTDRAGYGPVDQRVEAVRSHGLEHLRYLRRRWPDVPAVGEIVGVVDGFLEGHCRILRRCIPGRRPRP